jgi:hypothetical protein
MPFDHGLRLGNRQRLANARAKPIKAHKNQSVDGAEGFLGAVRRRTFICCYLLPQRQNFRLERCPRPKQIYHCPNNEPDKSSHPATASPDSRSTASQIEFATGTGRSQTSLYNTTRTHLSLNKDAPVHRDVEWAGNVVCRSILGGLHHQYSRI